MKNFIEKIRTKKRISRQELAEQLGMTYQNLSNIEKNLSSLNSEHLDKICFTLNCTVSEIFGEKEYSEKDTKFIKIKYYNFIINSYDNFLKAEFEEVFFPEEFFRILNIKDYANTICLKCYEKNMEPIISNGDIMIINCDSKIILNNKIYLINENGILKIKRIRQLSPFDTKVTILSENQIDGEYPPYDIDINIAKNNILGQVVFYGRSIL